MPTGQHLFTNRTTSETRTRIFKYCAAKSSR